MLKSSKMRDADKLDRIPRGNTIAGVNRAVIEYLLETDFASGDLLDAPCGQGEFLDVICEFFPGCDTYGADISLPDQSNGHSFVRSDLSGEDRFNTSRKFDVITSISGVMEFDNTLNFLRRLHECIESNGKLIITNDNLLTARDRVLYLFSGRFRQYPMFMADDASTWKILPLQNLLRLLHDARFKVIEIRYVPPKIGDWLWLPIAIPIWLFQTLSFVFDKNGPAYKEKATRYPFASLFSRHYLVICRPI